MGQALALAAIAYLIHLCGKFWPIGRRKGVVLQCGQQGIYPFAPQCAAKQAGKHPALCHKPGRRAGRQGARFQVCLHHFIALHGQRLFPLRCAGKGKIDTPLAESGAGFGQQSGLICTGQVHFIKKQERGDVVRGQQVPQGAGVALHAIRSADNQDGIVQNLQRAFGLGRKINMAGRVQKGDACAAHRKHGLLCKNGDAALALQGLCVQKGIAVVHPAQAAQAAALI